MASTSATAQSYNATNVLGEVLQIGADKNTGRFLAAIGGLNGARRVNAQQYDMSATYSLDTASQNTISENTSLTAGTPKFYAKTQVYNVAQIMKHDFAESSLRAAATQQRTGINAGGLAPELSEYDRAIMNTTMQMAADWEFSMLQGTRVDRSLVTTNVTMGGLDDATIGISTSTSNAAGAPLSETLVRSIMTTMAGNGAPMDNMAFVSRPTYADQLDKIFGFAPQAVQVGGTAVSQINTIYGPASVIWTNAAPANTLFLVDLNYCQPVVLPHDDGSDIQLVEYKDGASAKKGYIEGFMGFDFGTEAYHGSITNLA